MLISVMNNTKWSELQSRMYALGNLSPRWRTKSTENGYESEWDGEWYYHFSIGGYEDIEWVEIEVSTEQQRVAILRELQTIHVAGVVTENGYKVYGYVPPGQSIDYL